MLNLGSLKSLLDALVALDGQLCADGLQNLYQHDQQRRGKELQHHVKAVVTVVDGDLAKAAAADDAGHCADHAIDGRAGIGREAQLLLVGREIVVTPRREDAPT